MTRRLLAPHFLLALLLGGCSTATYRFRLVDAQTGCPVEGVRATVLQGTYFNNKLFYNYFAKDGGQRMDILASTGPDGLLIAKDIEQASGIFYTLQLEKSGYEFVELSAKDDQRRPWTLSYPELWYSEPAELRVDPAHVVKIPMRRKPTTAPAPATSPSAVSPAAVVSWIVRRGMTFDEALCVLRQMVGGRPFLDRQPDHAVLYPTKFAAWIIHLMGENRTKSGGMLLHD